MATFEINGSTYELPDSLQGDALQSTLKQLSGMGTPSQPKAAPSSNDKILNYLTETDSILGLPAGTSAAQIKQESRFNPKAVSPVGAEGLAQVMPTTRKSLEKKFGRTFDPYNEQDSLFMHREVMRENIKKFRDPVDALKAYNAGWNKANWNNPETNNYVAKITGSSPVTSTGQPQGQGQTTGAYKPFAKVRKDVDPATLNDDYDWIKAADLLYRQVENKPWEGSYSDLAEWGKDRLGWFNSNLPAMAYQANEVVKYGSQEDKEAFLYMMDTYDNTNFSVEGFQRWGKGVVFDPTTWVGLETLGAGKWLAGTAAKMEAKNLLIQALGRTGVVAGVEGGIYSASDNSIRQGVKVDAGAKEQFSGMELAAATGVGIVAGTVLGTAADAAISKISGLVRGSAKETPAVAPQRATVGDPIVTPQEIPNVAPEASQTPLRASEGVAPEAATVTPTIPEAPPVTPTIPDVSDPRPTITAKSGEVYVDTRNAGERFHGTSKELGSLSNDYALSGDNRNIYSAGFYTTDAVDIGVGYTKKGKGGNPVLYKVEESPVQLYDMEAPLTPEVEKIVKNALEDYFPTENADTGKPLTNLREIYDEFRADSSNNDLSRDDVQEYFDSIRDNLERQGYRGFEHTGGLGTNNKPHSVKIFWFPEQDIKLTKVNVEDYRPRPKSQIAPSDQAPLGSTLTPEEIAQATAREQPGRRAEDDIIPKFPEDNPVPKIDVPEANTGLRSTPTSMDEITKLGSKVNEQLKELNNQDLVRVLENFRTAAMPIEQSRIVARAVQMAADEIRIQKAELLKAINANPNAPDTPQKLLQLEELDKRLEPIDLADEAFGSIAGSILRQRQEGLPGVQGLSVESIMKETGASRPEAEAAYIKQVDDAQTDSAAQKVSAEYDRQFDEAVDRGDLVSAAKTASLKHRHLESLADSRAKGSGSFMQKLTELAISNVFTVKTVLVNLIPSAMKTLVVPSLKLILTNPLVKANRIEASATYGAMASTTRGALKAAVAAYKYEQALLTRDGSRLLEGELAISGSKGGIIRFFPRILNATDEFLSQLNYAGFIAGREGAQAAIAGAEKGLTGKELDTYVKGRVSKALTESLKPAQSEDLIRPIINKGVNLGYTGEKLAAYVEREAVKNPEALRHGNDEEALDYARDVLYKRRFSGEGSASTLAQGYERMTNAVPSLRFLFGQLFFRTPIRVFEEGVRLTPGLQILAPKFLTDLAGKNGQLRQIRAQGEALTSLAITGAVLTLYGQGRITGDGAYEDWRQQRARGDTIKAPPYTIEMSDGSYWSYRNIDPIATPVKIMLNGLERFERLNIRIAQGEFVDKTEFQKAMAFVTVGTSAVAQALRDANLVAGINTSFKFAENLSDPEMKEGALVKLMGEKLSLLVPNTLHKIAKENDPRITDPKTFWQVVEERLKSVGFDKGEIKSSYAYDAVGNVRSMADTDSLWSMFATTDVDEMVKGRSEKELFVLEELDRLSRTTGSNFLPPYKMADTGSLDYRTVMTKDGSKTLYDKWMENYRSLKPEEALAPLLSAPVPEGTFKYTGEKVVEARKIMKDFYEASYYQMMAEERQVVDKMITEELNKARAQSGQLDFRPR